MNTAAFGPIATSDGFTKASSWAELLVKPYLSEADKSLLIKRVIDAFTQGDGDFFDAMSFLCRNQNAPVHDRLRYGLLFSFIGHFGQRWHCTKAELLTELGKRGFILDERQLRRFCKELGIKLTPGKPGRPTKNPGR